MCKVFNGCKWNYTCSWQLLIVWISCVHYLIWLIFKRKRATLMWFYPPRPCPPPPPPPPQLHPKKQQNKRCVAFRQLQTCIFQTESDNRNNWTLQYFFVWLKLHLRSQLHERPTVCLFCHKFHTWFELNAVSFRTSTIYTIFIYLCWRSRGQFKATPSFSRTLFRWSGWNLIWCWSNSSSNILIPLLSEQRKWMLFC